MNKYGDPVLIVHGGSGDLDTQRKEERRSQEIETTILKALKQGIGLMKRGGRAAEAVVESISVLEDSEFFNAGKGSVLNRRGAVELSASIMDGHTRKAGSVAGIGRVQNPIVLAGHLMNHSKRVMLIGKGAEEYARNAGFTMVDNAYFKTKERIKQFENFRNRKPRLQKGKMGTVGAVALDEQGYLAAGTSTGGLFYSLPGRVGDSPLIGAGTYANHLAAVSCTGYGEYFIRVSAARDLVARMEYLGSPLEESARSVIFDSVKNLGGIGGLIALDVRGNFTATHSTEGMTWGFMNGSGQVQASIANLMIE